MGLNDIFLKIEKRTSWAFFGFVLAIIFGAFAIYTVYFIDPNPKLNFIIEANTTVLDLKENVRKLDIIYEGENIKQNNKNLSIYKIKIINPSKINILSNYFDSNDSLGFKLEKAEIVEKPEVVESSNDYLKHNVSFNIDSTGQIKFKPVIIEGGDFFVLRILVLHKQNEIPILKTFGKIAGIKDFKIIESYKSNEKKSFWTELIQGSFWIHIIRFICYIVIIALAVVTIAIPLSSLSDLFALRKKKKNIKKYKEKKKLSDTVERNLVYDLFLDNDIDYLISIQKFLLDERYLKIKLRNYIRRKDEKREINHASYIRPENSNEYTIYNDVIRNRQNNIVEELYEEKIIRMENNQLIVNTDFGLELNEFISYLKLI